MTSARNVILTLSLLVVVACWGTAGAAIITLNPGDSIQTAIDDATAGDEIVLTAGSYDASTTINVNKSITITGAGVGSVFINASASAGYGIHITAGDVILQDFSLQPPTPNYPIHASGTANSLGLDNLTIQHVAIVGVHQRSGFDVHGFNNVVLSHLTSMDATGGMGVAITGCVGVVVDNITTANNAWGSIAIYVSGASYLQRGCDNVVIDGTTLSLGENALFSQDEGGYYSTNISITGWGYAVRNAEFRDTYGDSDGFTFFQDTEANAIDYALNALFFVGWEQYSSVERLLDGHFVVGPGMSIQAAVDAADAAGTVEVLAGTYVEQVVINKDLALIGAGAASTTIQAPASLAAFFMTGANANYPIVFVDNASAVDIAALTVDGDGQGNANYRFQGVGFWNSGGSLTDVEVWNIIDTPFSGAQHGVGVYAYNDTGGPYMITLDGVLVENFQKTAVALSGDGLTVDLDNVTTPGAGPTAVTAQNGIQIAYGAGGTVDNCQTSGIAYTGPDWTATGFLIYQAGLVNGQTVALDACQTSLICQDSDGAFDDITVTNPTGDAVYAYSSGAKAAGGPRLLAQPFESPASKAGSRAAVDVSLSNSTFTGAGATDSWGPTAYGYGPLTFTVDNCIVTNWDWGVVLYDFGGASFDAVVSNSSIAGNTTYGMFSNANEQAIATCNWWGDISGPDVSPFNAGSGDAVEGDVVYAPWLDAMNGNCTEYGDNFVSPLPVNECLTYDNTCIPVTISFTRADVTASRAVSVTFQLSDELMLCTPDILADIAADTGPGTWLGSYTNFTQPRYDNGSKSYTVDLSVLGVPCGPENGGDLFTVMVAMDPAITADAIGTVTVTEVLVRDCANAPLAGIPGPPVEITVDLTAPPVLADLTAAQQKTGNDSDGTTVINVSWTAPGGDADMITLWRKGFGDYPEYDDGSGVVPTAPVTMANGWTEVVTLAATVTDYPDDPGARDFYYYAAYVTDLCGNVSLASDITADGTLSYHLGDVTDGVTNGNGDNDVSTADISHLGANYGITLVHNDPLNYLDVGATTDFSVDALPTTDNRVQFEDLMMFAINYGQVSKDAPARPTSSTRNEIALDVGEIGAVGSTFAVELTMAGDGQIQGLSVPLSWNGSVVAPVAMQPGAFMNEQGGQVLVLAPEPGTVDAALMGVADAGISGEGLLATVTFRVLASGDPAIGVDTITARDADNQAVAINGQSTSTPTPAMVGTRLYSAMPNPFNPSTTLAFNLARAGHATLRVYNVNGHLVRTIVSADLASGEHTYRWNGIDDTGRGVASGTYLLRLVTDNQVQSQRVMLLK